MPLPLIYVGAAGAMAAGAALHAWLTSEPPDAWEDADVFNARMRDMQRLAQALNDGFANCPSFMRDTAQLASWRGVRDGFSQFWKEVGSYSWTDPSTEVVAQAKAYTSKFYFWSQQYEAHKCGGSLSVPEPEPEKPVIPGVQQDWASTIKWGLITVAGLYGLKTLNDLFAVRK